MSTEYEQLKITALEIGEPLKDENGKIHPDTKKNLKPGIFNFYSKDSNVPEDFFKFSKHNPNSNPKSDKDLQHKNNLNISISAVVGKNGSGKSTIVEEMLRLINNLGYNYIDKTARDLAFDLEKAGKTINNRLYFSIFKKNNKGKENEEKYCISQGVRPGKTIVDNDQTCRFLTYNPSKNAYEETLDFTNPSVPNNDIANRISSSFFYTIVVNNSAYAFNTRDFEDEWPPKQHRNKHWLDGIFHKNDGYQTPIVLNPKRTNGNIDINTETQLAKDRLISLFLNKDIPDVNSQNILDSLIIARPFKWEETEEKINNNERWGGSKLKREIYSDLKKAIIDAWQEEYEFNAETVNDYDYKLATDYLGYKTLSIVWHYGYGVLKRELTTEGNNLHGTFIDDVNNLEFESNEYHLWKDKKREGNPANSLAVEAENDKSRNKPKYPKEYSDADARKYETRRDELFQKLWNQVPTLVNILNQDKSHITLKIRQTLAFLVLRHYDLNKNPSNNENTYPEDLINHGQVGYGAPPRLVIPNNSSEGERLLAEANFTAKFAAWAEAVGNLKNYHRFEAKDIKVAPEKEHFIEKYGWDYLDLLPAPCFETEIIVKNKETNEKYKITRLSSGERQQINTISTILYHLRNIESVKEAKYVIKYKHINLILDEIELYFHPELQRKFIWELLEAISQLKIDCIKSINIMLLTHSPFILSDIPKANVLFLRDGKQCEVDTETFGANIHTLYRNSFFMEGAPMGEFAKNKIKSLFERVKEKNMKEDDALLNNIKLVEEPIVRSQLLKLYKENTSHDFCNKEKRIEEIEQKIAVLEGKKDDKNKNF